MGKKFDGFRESMFQLARGNGGLALIECWICDSCGADVFIIHNMAESIPCPLCAHRHASKLPRYQTACEAAADAEKAYREPPAVKKETPDVRLPPPGTFNG